MSTNTATVTREAAERIQHTLTRLGFTHRNDDGSTQIVAFKSLEHVGDDFALIEVDVHRLPRGVRIERLADEHTLHELTAATGKHVYKLNTTGLTYCIPLKTIERAKLPTKAPFDLSMRPKHMPSIPLGISTKGPRIATLDQVGHMLVGGTTGGGKSNFLTTALAWLLAGREPSTIKAAIIDPKGVDFMAWHEASHLLAPIAHDTADAETVAAQVRAEILIRRQLFTQAGTRSLDEFNHKTKQCLPPVIFIVDEFTDLVLSAGVKSPLFSDLTSIVCTGRAFGIHAILATQHPKAEVINTLIRANLTTRVAFRCDEAAPSRVIIGDDRAARLPIIPGRAWVKVGEARFLTQTFYLPTIEADALAASAMKPKEPEAPSITPEAARLAAHALTHQGGAFTVSKLAQAFDTDTPHDKGPRVTRWTIQKTAEALAAADLLTKPANVTEARRVTPELAHLVEKHLQNTHQGTQESQGEALHSSDRPT